MAAPGPYFFLSYSHIDWDDYLEKFHDDLRRAVLRLSGTGEALDKVSFRDEDNVDTGEDWHTKILTILCISKVLVCIYSPSYFSKNRAHEFCAKEFAAFLRRDANLTYAEYEDRAGKLVGVSDAKNILPVLWVRESDLTTPLHDLPPALVRRISYGLKAGIARRNLDPVYKAKGMRQIAKRRTDVYDEIVQALARQIVELSQRPLPPLDPLPPFADLHNAFWDFPPGAAPSGDNGPENNVPADGETPGRFIVPAPVLGPQNLLVLELRDPAMADAEWRPYAEGPSVRALLDEMAVQDNQRAATLCPIGFEQASLAAAKPILMGASLTGGRPILLVDPLLLADPGRQAALLELLQSDWRGGVVFAMAEGGGVAPAAVQTFLEQAATALQASNRSDQIVLGGYASTPLALRDALRATADAILALIAKQAAVHQLAPANEGPVQRPTISNIPLAGAA